MPMVTVYSTSLAVLSTVQMSHAPDLPVDVGDGSSLLPSLTPNGRYLAFLSNASAVTRLTPPSARRVIGC